MNYSRKFTNLEYGNNDTYQLSQTSVLIYKSKCLFLFNFFGYVLLKLLSSQLPFLWTCHTFNDGLNLFKCQSKTQTIRQSQKISNCEFFLTIKINQIKHGSPALLGFWVSLNQAVITNFYVSAVRNTQNLNQFPSFSAAICEIASQTRACFLSNPKVLAVEIMSLTLASLLSSAYRLKSSKNIFIYSRLNMGFLVTMSLANTVALSFSIFSLLLIEQYLCLILQLQIRYGIQQKNNQSQSRLKCKMSSCNVYVKIIKFLDNYQISMKKRVCFKLSITNLVLFNEVYPFDFFLRVRTPNSESYQDSPIILAYQGECQQLFPWEFAVTKTNIRVQFVEISNARVEVQRGQINIQGLTDEDGQTVAILAHRTAKKLCLITYILAPYLPPDQGGEQQPRQQKNNIEETDQFSPTSQQKNQKQHNRPLFPKSERELLSQQIAQINKSIDKILTHEKNEHATFNKYLNQSTSFIREMMNNSIQNSRSRIKQADDSEMQQSSNQRTSILKQISENSENQKDDLSSKNWYKQKYGKDRPQILSNKSYHKESETQKAASEPQITYEKEDRPDSSPSSLILNQIWFNAEIQPNEVIFTQHPERNLLLKMKTTAEGTNYWKNPIELSNTPAMIITAVGSKGKQLQGCISKKQIEKGKAFLFDDKGQQKGFVKFKHKILNIYCVQTQQILDVDGTENKNKQPEVEDKDDYEIYKVQRKPGSKRSSRLQKTLEQQREAPKRQEFPSSPKNRYDLESNSGAISNMPFMRKEVTSEKDPNQRVSYLSDSHFSSATSTQFLSRVKLVNLKIDSISVKLEKNNNEFVGKLIKLSTRNKQPFLTETINLSQNLTWKAKGYIFQNISPFAQLKIQLCKDQNNSQSVIGTAKVCLALLDMQKENSIQFYHEYLRDQNENQIGELILGYESMGRAKKNKVSSLSRFPDDGFSEHDELAAQGHEPIRTTKRKRVKAKSSQKVKQKAKRNYLLEQPPSKGEKKKNIGVNGSQAKSLAGGTSAIRAKKYTGGNIIIGRAARFRFDPKSNRLGPGEYEVPSTFERHLEST